LEGFSDSFSNLGTSTKDEDDRSHFEY
jgi:hypothetical protein